MLLKARYPENVGILVEVLRPWHCGGGGWWEVSFSGYRKTAWGVRETGAAPDNWLMPIRPQPDEETETSDELETA